MWRRWRSVARCVAFACILLWDNLNVRLHEHLCSSNWTTVSPFLSFLGSGADLWEVCQAAGYERGVGHEDALPQLCATEMRLFPKRPSRQTRWPHKKVDTHDQCNINARLPPFNFVYYIYFLMKWKMFFNDRIFVMLAKLILIWCA